MLAVGWLRLRRPLTQANGHRNATVIALPTTQRRRVALPITNENTHAQRKTSTQTELDDKHQDWGAAAPIVMVYW